MRLTEFALAAEAIAGNRTAGASELAAELAPLLSRAIAAGPDAVVDVVRVVCRGQPAMATLWNLAAAALVEFRIPGRFMRVSAEVVRAPRALERAATAALRDALADVMSPRLLTLSYSGSVSRVLQAIATERPIEIVCAESLPLREGVRLHDEVATAGARVTLVLDAEITTRLPGAAAVVVGADALGARGWINKSGTFGLSAAAWISNVPVFVVAARNKAQAAALEPVMLPLPTTFERTPVNLATLFLTDAGPVPPENVAALSERFAPDVPELLSVIASRTRSRFMV